MTLVRLGNVQLHHGDAATVLPELAEASVALCLTDPPYGLLRGVSWDASRPSVDLVGAPSGRVMLPGGRLVALADDRILHLLTTDIVSAGFELEGLCMSIHADGRPRARNQPRPAFAPIIVARAPGPALVKALDDAARIPWRDDRDREQARRANTLHRASRRIYANDLDRDKVYVPNPGGRWPTNVFDTDNLLENQQHIFQIPRVRDAAGHVAAKPVALLVQLLRLYSAPADIVLDPFSPAVPSTGVAALASGRRAVLIERERRFVDMALANLDAAEAGSYALPASLPLNRPVAAPVINMSENEHLHERGERATSGSSNSRQERTADRDSSRLLTPREIAPELGISVRTLQRLRRANQIPTIRVGARSVRFDLQAGTRRAWRKRDLE